MLFGRNKFALIECCFFFFLVCFLLIYKKSGVYTANIKHKIELLFKIKIESIIK